MTVPYDAYASIYDRVGQSRFSLRMVRYARDLWLLAGIEVDSVLELACGTGSAAIALANRGFRVTGVDRSSMMLEQARTKAERHQANVRWIQQDLAHLDIDDRFAAATCFYDSLNYFLVPEELQAVFGRVRAHLQPGGVFTFDAISEYAVSTTWGNEIEYKISDDAVRIWRASYDDLQRIGTLKIDYFTQVEGGNLYSRVTETHQHRGYDSFEMRELLEEAGFELLNAYACLTYDAVQPKTYRIAYLARRPLEDR